jgi:hypothetical protein
MVERAVTGDMSIFQGLGFVGAIKELLPILIALAYFVCGRTVAVTTQGDVAVVPPLTESGDVFVYFKGGTRLYCLGQCKYKERPNWWEHARYMEWMMSTREHNGRSGV